MNIERKYIKGIVLEKIKIHTEPKLANEIYGVICESIDNGYDRIDEGVINKLMDDSRVKRMINKGMSTDKSIKVVLSHMIYNWYLIKN